MTSQRRQLSSRPRALKPTETTTLSSGHTETTQSVPVAELPGVLRVGTHPMGSMYNAFGSGLATVIGRNTPIEVKVIATSGPTEWEPMFTAGDMDMGIANSFDSGMGYLGESEYANISNGQGFPIRLLTVGSSNQVAVVVPRDSDIKTAADLKGKRFVGVVTRSVGITTIMKAFLVNHGLSESDVKMVAVPGVVEGVRAIIEGRADAALTTLGMPILQELDAAIGARLIGIDPSPEALARLQEIFPARAVEKKPGDKSPQAVGIIEPINVMDYDNYLVARADLFRRRRLRCYQSALGTPGGAAAGPRRLSPAGSPTATSLMPRRCLTIRAPFSSTGRPVPGVPTWTNSKRNCWMLRSSRRRRLVKGGTWPPSLPCILQC